jgi:hypothetical protein
MATTLGAIRFAEPQSPHLQALPRHRTMLSCQTRPHGRGGDPGIPTAAGAHVCQPRTGLCAPRPVGSVPCDLAKIYDCVMAVTGAFEGTLVLVAVLLK